MLYELNQACRYADHLVAMKAGQVFAHGKPHTVMTEMLVKEVFGLEGRIIDDPVARTPLCIPPGRKVAIGAGA